MSLKAGKARAGGFEVVVNTFSVWACCEAEKVEMDTNAFPRGILKK